jgi:F1F0 ATPase subunit 2
LWTVKQIPASSRPGLLVGTSFVIRQVVTVALLVLACRDHWERWGAAMAGFLIIRTLLMKTQQADMKRKRT